MNFVLVPSEREFVPERLRAAVPEFAQSEEYSLLIGNGEDLPGIVLASFASYLLRVATVEPASDALRRGVEVVGSFWRSNDCEIVESLEDEFFDALQREPKGVPIVFGLMEPALQEGYLQWSAREKYGWKPEV